MVQTKLEGGEVKEQPAAKDGSGEVVDLLEALQRSVDRAKASRGEPVSEKTSASSRAPAKKTAAKTSTPAKKTAATSTAKKTVAKKKAS